MAIGLDPGRFVNAVLTFRRRLAPIGQGSGSGDTYD